LKKAVAEANFNENTFKDAFNTFEKAAQKFGLMIMIKEKKFQTCFQL
jgi:hypothetical protein